jgi:hypothetical protein
MKGKCNSTDGLLAFPNVLNDKLSKLLHGKFFIIKLEVNLAFSLIFIYEDLLFRNSNIVKVLIFQGFLSRYSFYRTELQHLAQEFQSAKICPRVLLFQIKLLSLLKAFDIPYCLFLLNETQIVLPLRCTDNIEYFI